MILNIKYNNSALSKINSVPHDSMQNILKGITYDFDVPRDTDTNHTERLYDRKQNLSINRIRMTWLKLSCTVSIKNKRKIFIKSVNLLNILVAF